MRPVKELWQTATNPTVLPATLLLIPVMLYWIIGLFGLTDGDVGDAGDGDGYSALVGYAAGPLSASGGQQQTKGTAKAKTDTTACIAVGTPTGCTTVGAVTAATLAQTGNYTQTAVGASYDFGMAKLSGIMTQHAVENQSATTASNIGVTIPVGAFSLAVQAGTADRYIVSNTAAGTAVTQTSVDWRLGYALSKRTTIYGVYSTLDGNNGSATAASAAVNGDSLKRRSVFVLHSF